MSIKEQHRTVILTDARIKRVTFDWMHMAIAFDIHSSSLPEAFNNIETVGLHIRVNKTKDG